MTEKYTRKDLMKIAIEEQQKCTEFPKVGAVVAKSGVKLSTGYRGEQEKVHAERVAIEKLTPEQLSDSTLYTTLEPCISVKEDQSVDSCTDLIIQSRIAEVIIGVLDPNGTIYSQGYGKLLKNDIRVSFFDCKLREAIEKETFEYGEIDKIVGPGKRRIPVVHSGISLDVQFSESDTRTFEIQWCALQPDHSCVDLMSANGAVRVASGVTDISQITDPMVFRFPSHAARMRKGMIAVVRPAGATFSLLVKLLEIDKRGILFCWEMRNMC